MGIRNYNNTSVPQTILNAGGIDNNPLTVGITVGDNTSYPPVPFTLGLERGTPNQEVVECTALSGTTGFIVTRGFNGSPVVAHPQGASVELTSAAIDYAEANVFINIMTTKGDIITFAAGPTRLGVGADGTALTADHTQTSGLAWVQPVPPGVVFYTAASAAPAGFVLANGQSLARAGVAAICSLRSVRPTALWTAHTSTSRTLRPAPSEATAPATRLAATGGSDSAPASVAPHTHGNSILIGGTPVTTEIVVYDPGSTIQLASGAPSTPFGVSYTVTPSLVVSIDSAGSATPINIVNKYIVLTPIIKL